MRNKFTVTPDKHWDIVILTKFVVDKELGLIIKNLNGVENSYTKKNQIDVDISGLFTVDEIIESINLAISDYLGINIKSNSVSDLKKRLKKAVDSENYELAAMINKKIKSIKP